MVKIPLDRPRSFRDDLHRWVIKGKEYYASSDASSSSADATKPPGTSASRGSPIQSERCSHKSRQGAQGLSKLLPLWCNHLLV
jgi:hypothetical protein